MTDSDRQEYERWFAIACRRARLIGAIEVWAQAPFNGPTSAAEALAYIRFLIVEYDAEQATGGGRDD